ncbi:Uma2 family endonuclease [soil metagenome]|nr:Uma2 family endonuclease [Gemmatimonadota bacterium]
MSTATRDVPLLSPEEYLVAEREAEQKSEYFGGEVVAFAGASPAHNAIVFNLAGVLYPQLRGRPCRGFPSDLRVHNPVTGSFTYPDVVVVCGEPVFHDQQRDTLLNPTLVVEILSESTEQRDRGIKAEHYRQTESIQEYLFVRQDKPHVEHFRRYGPRQWMLTEASDLNDALELPAIGCTLALRDIYDKVDLHG